MTWSALTLPRTHSRSRSVRPSSPVGPAGGSGLNCGRSVVVGLPATVRMLDGTTTSLAATAAMAIVGGADEAVGLLP